MRKHGTWRALGLVSLIALVGFSPVAFGDDAATIEQLKAQMQQMQSRMKEYETRLNDVGLQAAEREEIRAMVSEMLADAQDQGSMPSWAKDLTIYGDLRLRYRFDCEDNDYRKDRHRMQYRLRFGMTKTWMDDQLEVGFRLASGEQRPKEWIEDLGISSWDTIGQDPTIADQTASGNFNDKPIWIDLAYAKWTPKSCDGLMVIAGKMPAPFYATDIIWDHDVTPEGIFAQYEYKKMGCIVPFVGAGFFIAREVQDDSLLDALTETSDNHDTTMTYYTAGVKWQINDTMKLTVAGNIYDWEHYDKDVLPGLKATRGNTAFWMQDFLVVGAMGQFEWQMMNLPWTATAEFLHNCAENNNFNEHGGEACAVVVGMKVGNCDKKGSWEAGYTYAWVGQNSVPGYFVDSNFGYANRKGHRLRGAYALTDYLHLGVSLYHTQPIHSMNDSFLAGLGFDPDIPEGLTSYGQDERTSVLLDLTWKF